MKKLFFAGLLSLLVWAGLVGIFKDLLAGHDAFLPVGGAPSRVDSEDVLFDNDTDVLWSDPSQPTTDTVASVPSTDGETSASAPSTDAQGPKYYEFVLTPDYINLLLERYSDEIPLEGVTAVFSGGAVYFSGEADIPAIASRWKIPAALVIFLPKRVPCTLRCHPEVSEGQLRIRVTEVRTKAEILTPYLSRPEILSAVEAFLNEMLARYLPRSFVMRSVTVSDLGLYLRYSVG